MKASFKITKRGLGYILPWQYVCLVCRNCWVKSSGIWGICVRRQSYKPKISWMKYFLLFLLLTLPQTSVFSDRKIYVCTCTHTCVCTHSHRYTHTSVSAFTTLLCLCTIALRAILSFSFNKSLLCGQIWLGISSDTVCWQQNLYLTLMHRVFSSRNSLTKYIAPWAGTVASGNFYNHL